MSLMLTTIIGAFVFLIGASRSDAQVKEGAFLQAGILYYTQSLRDESTANGNAQKSSRATTNLNVTLAYNLGNAFSLGLKYYNETAEDNWSFNSSRSSSSTPAAETSALGPMAGLQFGGLAIFASYMALQAPEKALGSLKYYGGDGYVVDVMYLIGMGGWFFGPQISIINFNYKSSSISGAKNESFGELTEEYLFPYFSFFLQF